MIQARFMLNIQPGTVLISFNVMKRLTMTLQVMKVVYTALIATVKEQQTSSG